MNTNTTEPGLYWPSRKPRWRFLPQRRRERFLKLLERAAMEPPLRMLVWGLFHVFKPSASTRAVWSISPRHVYLLGVITAAELAIKQKLRQISVFEFGVANGRGLIALQEEAAAVEKETGVAIKVYGFDTGAGTPGLIGDYRDHPDSHRPGDFPMDEAALRARLSSRTTLILGDIAETVPNFFEKYNPPPVGFVSIDIDSYSAVRHALKIFTLPMLRRVPIFMPNQNIYNHKFAGAMLAVEEFNQQNSGVKIDRWYAVKRGSAFPERHYFDQLYVAHDLDAISKAGLDSRFERRVSEAL